MESTDNAIAAVYGSHHDAEEAIKALARAGFDMKALSIVGRDYHTEDHVVGYYHAGERMRYWGKMGGFWGGIWGLLSGGAFFFVPGFGPLLIGGPLVTWIISGLEGAVAIGGLSALGAGLHGLGMAKDSVLEYESAIKAGKYLVLVHCDTQSALRARDALGSSAERLQEHALEDRAPTGAPAAAAGSGEQERAGSAALTGQSEKEPSRASPGRHAPRSAKQGS